MCLLIEVRLNLQGKVSLVTKNALHQLHLLIFALAVMHIVYSVLTMALGRAKVMFISHFKVNLSFKWNLIIQMTSGCLIFSFRIYR